MSQKILVVEDDSETRALIEMFLKGADYEVITLRGEEEVLTVLRAVAPDLVLLDVSVSGLDPFELCRCLRASAETDHIKIMLLTEQWDIDSCTAGLLGGADDFLFKPIRVGNLIERVQVLLSTSGQSVWHY